MGSKFLCVGIFALLFSCKTPVYENLEVKLISDNSKLDLQLYYQNDYTSAYEEDKSIKSEQDNQTYIFSLEDKAVKRFRIDLDNLVTDKVIIKEIVINEGGKEIVLKGKEIISLFIYNQSIETILNQDNTVTLNIKDKKDPYFVSQNLNILLSRKI